MLTVPYFFVRSSGSSAYRYGQPSWFHMYQAEEGGGGPPGFIVMRGRESGRGEKKSKTVPAPYKVDLTLIPGLDSEHLSGQYGRPFRKAHDLRRSYGQIGD